MTTFTGKTANEAIQEGLATLHANQDEVTIKLIQEARRGFLGLGKREAKVEMVIRPTYDSKPKTTETEQTTDQPDKKTRTVDSKKSDVKELETEGFKYQSEVDQLIDYLNQIVIQLGIHADINVTHQSSKVVKLNFITKDEGLLIGKHGLTINALQSLAEIYLNRLGLFHLSVELDTADYRARRADILTKLAERTAREVVAEGQPFYLDPMPSFERKIIHKTLEHSSHVRTYSAGKEPHRAVVIAPR